MVEEDRAWKAKQQYEALSEDQVVNAVNELARKGKLNSFKDKLLTDGSYAQLCVMELVVIEANTIVPTVFKIGGVPEERKPEKKNFKCKIKYDTWNPTDTEREIRIQQARDMRFKEVRESIQKCIHEEVQKPSEIIQTSEDRYPCGIDIHVPDRQSIQIIQKALNPFDVTSTTRWKSRLINKMFSRDYMTDRQIRDARKLY